MSSLRSSVVIARLLDSEGFSEFAANATERYWMRSICDPRARRRYRKLDKELSQICTKLTDAEKLILGKFISLHKRMAFDTGLRIGLTAFARKHDKEYRLVDLGEQSPSGGSGRDNTTTTPGGGVQDHSRSAQIVGAPEKCPTCESDRPDVRNTIQTS